MCKNGIVIVGCAWILWDMSTVGQKVPGPLQAFESQTECQAQKDRFMTDPFGEQGTGAPKHEGSFLDRLVARVMRRPIGTVNYKCFPSDFDVRGK